MPFLQMMDFVSSDFSVSYRGTSEPQELVVEAKAALPSELPCAQIQMNTILFAIAYGAAGGAEFAPAAGRARLVSDSTAHAKPWGPEYRWELEIAGVAPLFLRNMVDMLRRCGCLACPVVSMHIAGSAMPDASPLTIDERHVRAWLDDPNAYPGVWSDPGFEVIDHPSDKVNVRVRFAGPISPALSEHMRIVLTGWLNVVANYLSPSNAEVQHHVQKNLPRFGKSRVEMSALYPEFLHARPPSRAVLLNMLAHVHATVAPILRVELGM